MKIAFFPPVAIAGLLAGFFLCGLWSKGKSQIRDDHKLRKYLSEQQIDSMVADSFPASDPPSTY